MAHLIHQLNATRYTANKSATLWVVAVASILACGDPPHAHNDTDAGAITRPDAAPDPNAVPRIESAACRYEVPTELGLDNPNDYECGDLVVYENRAIGSHTLRLHYIRFTGSSAADATVYLAGGPGGDGSGIIGHLGRGQPTLLDGLLTQGDFLIISQRGTALSVPSLTCNDAADCAASLSLQADLTQFNTANNADDIDELRHTLGYERLNVFGISYGSRLALEVMRRHGNNVRAAVIDGDVPAQVNWPAEIYASFHAALIELGNACERSTACDSSYGDVIGRFLGSIDALNRDPLAVNSEWSLDGTTYATLIFRMMYANSTYPWLPLVFHDIAERRTDRITAFLDAGLQSLTQSRVADGMYYSVVCGELFNPPDTAAFAEATSGLPRPLSALAQRSWSGFVQACDRWPKGPPRPELSTAVTSSVPTFVASGRLDPITPPEFGDIAAGTLTDSHVAVFEASGHGATVQTACARTAFLAFLADPAVRPKINCANEQTIEFLVPNAARSFGFPHARVMQELHTTPMHPLWPGVHVTPQ